MFAQFATRITTKIISAPLKIDNIDLGTRLVQHIFFTKTAELAQAQAQLATLQNELNTTQSQYVQIKEQRKARAEILKQAFLSPPPQARIYPAKKCLKA